MKRWLAVGACLISSVPQAFGNDALDGAIAIKSQEAVAHVPVVEIESKVPWTKNPIRIDGDLSDWKDVAPAVALEGDKHASWFRGVYKGREDLSASVRLCRDDRNLYIALEIIDGQLPAADRVSFAFADAKSRLITTWQDVGKRYGVDDVHTIFVLGKDDTVGLHWAHVQERMDRVRIQDSFGSETERRTHLEEGGAADASQAKIFSKTARRAEGGKTITTFEVSFPWKSLTPYNPVSYGPLKFNIAVEDKDGEGVAMTNGAVAWTPGLIGTYSAAHFPTLTFDPPSDRKAVDVYAQTPAVHYINQNIIANFAFFNHGEARNGELQLFAGDKQVGSTKIALPHGGSRKDLPVHSEKLNTGKTQLKGRLVLDGQPAIDIPVHVPTLDDMVSVQKIAEFEAKIAALERNAQSLEALYEQVRAKGLDTAYPRAYLTLQKMFIPRCRIDLEKGDAARVLKNTAYLEELYGTSKNYMEAILKDPNAQLKVPNRFNPDVLTMKDGYYFDGDRPVFLWGPCVFWYLKADQPLVIDLGFNSVVTEVPQDASNAEVQEHMKMWFRDGVSLNASMSVPSLAATGADAKKLGLLKEHPEMANLDGNNFVPFLVQHPIARREIADAFKKSIGFWKNFKGVRSYWLWNEPWYLNYSELTRQDFIENYLKPRYKTIEALNQRWKGDYKSFDEIKLITWPDPSNYAPWYDFQQFRDDLLADFWGFLDKTAKENDSTKPTHVKFMAASLHSGNMEKYQGPFNIAGHDGSSGNRDIVFMDYMRSIHPDRPLVNTEIHIAYAGQKTVEMVAWRLALHGLADGNWWCWHSNERFSDSLANAESMYALAISGLDMQRVFAPHMFALNQKDTAVATLFPDVVERRSDIKMVRIRFELATAQYPLGLRPFYATESRIAQGELFKHKILLAGESDYVKESTYRAVLDYVRKGGTAIVTRGGFAHNEYGDPRDTSELIKLEGGEAYGEGARIYPLDQGKVICIDAIENQADIVTDGGQALRGGPLPENQERRRAYERTLAKVIADNGLEDAVRIVSADDSDPDALYGVDWRSTEVNGAYTLAVLPYGKEPPFDNIKLVTKKPIRKIVNLITEKEISPEVFKLENGPNLFHIELEK